jgi:hypothetical protein
MATDLTIVCPGVRGTVAAAFEAIARAGVDVSGYAGFQGILHVLVDDPARAREAVEAVGIEVRADREVLVIPVGEAPGPLGETLRRIADAEVGLELLYLTSDGRAVIGASDLESARDAAGRPPEGGVEGRTSGS